MLRTGMLVAAISGCVVSTSFGGFVVTPVLQPVDATFDRMEFYARNTGGDTGVGLLAVEFTSTATAGVAVWRSMSSGNWSPTNPTDVANRSAIRIDFEDVSSTSLVSKTPAANQPLAPAYGPLTVALGNFGVVIAGLSGAVPAETGNGALFASLYVSKNYHARFSGNVGGSAGAKVPFAIEVSCSSCGGFPTIVPGSTANVVFGQVVTNGAPFSVVVNVTHTDPTDLISLAVGPVAGISNIVVTPTSATSPASFTVTGTVDYSLHGMTVVVPVIASDDGMQTSNGSFSLVVTPEPSSLCGLLSLALTRRRRA